MLADLFRKALAEYKDVPVDGKLRAVLFFGEEVLKRYESNQDTLAAIAGDYVKVRRELDALQEVKALSS